MRNLKKILALVMALVMSMSLVTIANASDFTDADDITYEEAADVMNAIGVIEGYEDGSFDPNGTLVREEAATLVTWMLLGDNAGSLGIERSTFDDVLTTRWSAPAIEYCVSLGIIDGAGDGNFYPRGQLTAVAFAKVLLTALGYDADTEGLVGTTWSVNTAALAMEVGLDDGIEDLTWNAAITREQAAQMALNTIKAPLVAYEGGVTVVVGDTPVSFGSGDAYYITTTLAREQRISDEQLSNSNDYTVEFGERYFPNLRLNREADEFERPSHTWIYNGDEIGSYTDYDLQVATYTEAVTGRELYDLLGSSTIADYSIAYYVDGAESDTIKESNMIRTNTRDYSTTGNGVLTQVFVDHTNEEITITSVNTYLAVADADYNESRGELSLTVYQSEANPDGVGKTVDVEDIDTITEYTEGDFMLVNMAATGTGSDPYEVVRVNDVESMVDCTVTRFSKGSSVTVDGEAYDYAQKAIYKDGVLDLYNDGALDNYTYTFYLDQYGYVIGAEIYEGEANYLFLTGYDINGSNLSVNTATAAAIFLDGEMTEIRVDVQDTNENIEDCNDDADYEGEDYALLSTEGNNRPGVTNEDGESEYNRWFRYTVDENNVYTLTPAQYWVNEKAETEGQEINSANVRVGTGSNRAYGNDASVYITVDTDVVDYTTQKGITKVNGIYTGVQEVDLKVDSTTAIGLYEDVGIFALADEDGYIIAAVIIGEDSNNSQNYAYILDTDAQEEYTENGDTFWSVEAIVDNDLVTLTVADYGSTINNIQRHIHDERGAMYRVTYNGDGHVIEAELCEDEERGDVNDDYVYGILDYDNRDIDPDYDSVYNVEGISNEALSLRGRTLYIGDTNDYGLFTASDAKIFVVQYETDSEGNRDLTVESYTNASAALNSLKNDEDFSGSISAVLSDAGTAEYLVINSDDDIGLITDDGTSDSDSGEYFTATTHIYNYGVAAVSVTAERPDWLDPDDADALNYTFDIYVNGEPYDTNVSGTAMTTGRTTAVTTWNNTGANEYLYRPIETGDVITVENFEWTDLGDQTYYVRFVDGNRTIDSSLLRGSTVTSGTVALTNYVGTLNFGPRTTEYTAGNYGIRIEDAHNGTGTIINRSLPYTSLYDASVTVGSYVNGQNEPLEDYLYIELDLSDLTEDTTVGFDFSNIEVALSNWDVEGSDDEDLVLDFSVVGGTESGFAAGTPKSVTVALASGLVTDNYAIFVELDGMGPVQLNGTTPVTLGTVTVDEDIVYELSDVTVTAYPKLEVIAAEWTSYGLTVEFNRPVATYNGSTFTGSDYRYTESDSDGVAVDSATGANGYVWTFTFINATLEAGDTMLIGSGPHDAELSGNRIDGGVTLTLMADGYVRESIGSTTLPKP